MEITGGCVENNLWRTRDISLTCATSLVILNCGTNNVEQNQPKDITVGITEIANFFAKKGQGVFFSEIPFAKYKNLPRNARGEMQDERKMQEPPEKQNAKFKAK